MKIGLVLEGGGMRGLYTSAVIDYFLTTKLPIDGVVSVSAGALFGINLFSENKYRTLRYNLKYINDKRYMSFHNLLTTGNLIGEQFAFHDIPNNLDPFDNETFMKQGKDFFVTVTNIKTGEPEYFNIQDGCKQIELLRATSALPFVSKPVHYEGQDYLDGGIADSIPYKKAIALGYDKIIVVLTRPIQYRKSKPNSLPIELGYRKYPELVKTLKERYLNYNQSVEELIELEKEGKVFVIRPSETMAIDRLEKDPQKLVDLYKLGFKDIKVAYEDLIDYLKA